jgi:hypothetical protein
MPPLGPGRPGQLSGAAFRFNAGFIEIMAPFPLQATRDATTARARIGDWPQSGRPSTQPRQSLVAFQSTSKPGLSPGRAMASFLLRPSQSRICFQAAPKPHLFSGRGRESSPRERRKSVEPLRIRAPLDHRGRVLGKRLFSKPLSGFPRRSSLSLAQWGAMIRLWAPRGPRRRARGGWSGRRASFRRASGFWRQERLA